MSSKGKAKMKTIQKDRWVAVLMAVFLGSFGIHKFYLNQGFWGLMYLFLCWTYVPGIVSIIEAIYYLAIGEAEFHRKYDIEV